jgi:hypothetical protein
MTKEETDGRRYRQHAGELRAIAKSMKDTPTKLALISFADDFDRIAENMEATLDRVPC